MRGWASPSPARDSGKPSRGNNETENSVRVEAQGCRACRARRRLPRDACCRAVRERPGAVQRAGHRAPDHRAAELADEPGDHGRRLHGRRAVEVPAGRRPEPQHDVERRPVPQLPELLQHLLARDRVPGVRRALRPGRKPAEPESRHGAAPALLGRVHEPARARDHVRAGAAGGRRVPERPGRSCGRPRRSTLYRQPAARQVPGDLHDAARRLGPERPDAGDLEHVHVRRHRRNPGDHVGRQPAGPADLDARARALARHAR